MRAWLAVIVLLAGCAGSGEKTDTANAPDSAAQPEASSVGTDPGAASEEGQFTEAVVESSENAEADGSAEEAPDSPGVPATPVAEAPAPAAPAWFEAGVLRGEGGVRVSVWAEADSVRGAQRAAIDTALKRLASELGRPAPTWEVLRSSVLPAEAGTYRAYVQLACEVANDG